MRYLAFSTSVSIRYGQARVRSSRGLVLERRLPVYRGKAGQLSWPICQATLMLALHQSIAPTPIPWSLDLLKGLELVSNEDVARLYQL
mmetsp:Transcript_35802/g.89085  ORF Transcript_35802/g.89085 Transcript_35802/m.89085 type:complete len:88 (+) Transcript_35802:132-395(+)